MKRKNRARSSSLFLMELILAILFFSVASAVCVQFFVKSHMLSNDSKALNLAVNECTSIAEMIDTTDGIADCVTLLKSQYPEGEFPDDMAALDATILIYYDDSFSPCAEADRNHTLSLLLTEENHTLTARMDFDSIYQLETKYHIPYSKEDIDETR